MHRHVVKEHSKFDTTAPFYMSTQKIYCVSKNCPTEQTFKKIKRNGQQ